MSPREKNLLLLFAGGGFIILNLLGYQKFVTLRKGFEADLRTAEAKLQAAAFISNSREQVAPAMEWLDTNQPRPADYQNVQSSLQKLAESEATGSGLTIKNQKLLDVEQQPGANYHRVKVQFTVTGMENALYRWIVDRVNDPAKLRAVTSIRLSPNKENDSQIDCVAIVEQWFVPATNES